MTDLRTSEYCDEDSWGCNDFRRTMCLSEVLLHDHFLNRYENRSFENRHDATEHTYHKAIPTAWRTEKVIISKQLQSATLSLVDACQLRIAADAASKENSSRRLKLMPGTVAGFDRTWRFQCKQESKCDSSNYAALRPSQPGYYHGEWRQKGSWKRTVGQHPRTFQPTSTTDFHPRLSTYASICGWHPRKASLS